MILPITREVDNENDTGRTDLARPDGKEIQIFGFKDIMGISKNPSSVKEILGVPATRSLSTKSFGISYRPSNSTNEFYPNKEVKSADVFKRSKAGALTLVVRENTSPGIEEGINAVV